jgi:hypothetical protein
MGRFAFNKKSIEPPALFLSGGTEDISLASSKKIVTFAR